MTKEIWYDWYGQNLFWFQSINNVIIKFPKFIKFLTILTETANYKNINLIIFGSFLISYFALKRNRQFYNKDNYIKYLVNPFIRNYFIVFTVYFSSLIIMYFAKKYFNYVRPICAWNLNITVIEVHYKNMADYLRDKCINDSSFPSVHSAISVLIVTYLWQFIDRMSLKFLLIIYVLFIGLSRIVLGLHYPADVLGGYILGSICYWSIYLIMIYKINKHDQKITQFLNRIIRE
ncbi:MAG: phosphatase PAP2 family protein [Alphaproteobacteria bacterium]